MQFIENKTWRQNKEESANMINNGLSFVPFGKAVFYKGCLTHGGNLISSLFTAFKPHPATEKLEKVWGRREEKEFLNVTGNHVSGQNFRNPQVKERIKLSHIRLSDSAQYDSK